MWGFTEKAARELVGTVVRKRARPAERHAEQPEQLGRVVLYERSEMGDAYAVLVYWGGGELSRYDTPEEFAAEVETGKAPGKGLTH